MTTAGYATQAPPRKGLAVASLVFGILSLLTCGCLGVGAITGVVLGIIALVQANRQPGLYGGRGMAVAGIATSGISLLLLPIAAAIAIPSLLRARVSANEAATIGDVRTVLSAQAAYQAANGGLFDSQLRCLNQPASCIPNSPSNLPTLLDSELASLVPKNGYRREFHAGPVVSPVPRLSSPTSTASFAYVAVPVTQGRTGIRAFCGDASGNICSTRDGKAPRVTEGRCDDPSCTR